MTRKPKSQPAPLKILTQVRHGSAELPPTARRIATFIAKNAGDVIRMSITGLAEQTGASEGSVVAFCRRVGATGFQDLKILLARDLVDPVQLIHEDLKPGHTVDEVGERVFAAHAASLAETLKLMSSKSLIRAVEALRNARRVEIYGIGSAAPVAEDLAYRLMQLGYASKAVTDSHIQAVSAAMTSPEVTTVTISHSGSTIETILATRLAHERGATTIGITRLGKSPLSRHCGILLHTVANETKYRPEAMSSRVAQLAIIDTLVSCCALSNPEKAIENLQRTAETLSEKRY